MKRRNSGYTFYVLILIVFLVLATTGWIKAQEYIAKRYIEEHELNMLNEQDIEDIKSEAYDEGYEEGKDDGYNEGYEEALIDTGAEVGVTWATVYYTDNGSCYHTNPKCTSIRYNDNVHETTLDRLQDSDLKPCDICVAHGE